MRTRTILTAGVLVTLLGACGGGAAGPGSSSSAADDEGEAGAAVGHAAASSSVDHVVAGGAAYEVTCAEPDRSALGPDIRLDEDDPRFDRATSVGGEATETVIALHSDGRVEACPAATWVLAFGRFDVADEPSGREHARRRCAVPAVPDDPRCAEGGPFWFGTDPSVDGTEGDGRSAVWVTGQGPAPAWRLDPLAVVDRQVDEGPVPDFYRLRRVGLRLLEERPEEVFVEVLYQDVFDNAGVPLGHEQREHHTLGRLPGRDGWYEKAYIVARYGDRDLDDATLDAAWAEGADRVLIDVDRR